MKAFNYHYSVAEKMLLEIWNFTANLCKKTESRFRYRYKIFTWSIQFYSRL